MYKFVFLYILSAHFSNFNMHTHVILNFELIFKHISGEVTNIMFVKTNIMFVKTNIMMIIGLLKIWFLFISILKYYMTNGKHRWLICSLSISTRLQSLTAFRKKFFPHPHLQVPRRNDNTVIFHTYHKSQANDPDPPSRDRTLCGPVSCIITPCHLYGTEQSPAL